jgi:hypothetical protein
MEYKWAKNIGNYTVKYREEGKTHREGILIPFLILVGGLGMIFVYFLIPAPGIATNILESTQNSIYTIAKSVVGAIGLFAFICGTLSMCSQGTWRFGYTITLFRSNGNFVTSRWVEKTGDPVKDRAAITETVKGFEEEVKKDRKFVEELHKARTKYENEERELFSGV